MTDRRFQVALTLFLLPGLALWNPQPLNAASEPSPVPSLLEFEAQLMEAIRTKDRASLETLLAEEFEHLDESGQTTSREEFLAAVAGLEFEIRSLEGSGLNTKVYGEFGVIAGVQIAVVDLGQDQVTTVSTLFTDICVVRDGRWLLSFAHTTDLAPPTSEP